MMTLLVYQAFNAHAQEANIPTKIDKKDFNPATLIWFTLAAEKWEDALPIGN